MTACIYVQAVFFLPHIFPDEMNVTGITSDTEMVVEVYIAMRRIIAESVLQSSG